MEVSSPSRVYWHGWYFEIIAQFVPPVEYLGQLTRWSLTNFLLCFELDQCTLLLDLKNWFLLIYGLSVDVCFLVAPATVEMTMGFCLSGTLIRGDHIVNFSSRFNLCAKRSLFWLFTPWISWQYELPRNIHPRKDATKNSVDRDSIAFVIQPLVYVYCVMSSHLFFPGSQRIVPEISRHLTCWLQNLWQFMCGTWKLFSA